MKPLSSLYPLYVKKTKDKGWGVYCRKSIPKGRTFEIAPIILIPRKYLKRMNNTPIDSYRFEYRGDSTCIVLSYGSLYNHADEDDANCEYRINRRSQTFSFYAVKNIPANTEITHNYNWDETDYEFRRIPHAKNKKKKKPKTS
jgi:SET domain-containing protein